MDAKNQKPDLNVWPQASFRGTDAWAEARRLPSPDDALIW